MASVHVWTAPAWQELSDDPGPVGLQSCVRPVSAALRPLALMESASLVPNNFPHSKCCTLIGLPKLRSQPLPSRHRFLPTRCVSALSLLFALVGSQAEATTLCR